MAFKIKKQKVNRRYLYNCIKAQQEKINALFEIHNKIAQQRIHLEQRVKELSEQLYQRPIDSVYQLEPSHENTQEVQVG